MPERQGIVSIQVLRAVAALMVVFGHAAGLVLRSAPADIATPLSTLRLPTGAGVDLFFVISGFIMLTSSGKLFGQPGASAEFMRRRLIRIVPLYWACTSLYLVITFGRSVVKDIDLPAPLAVFASYFFIPYDTWGIGLTTPFPIFDLGWTLNYEMFFYVLFAALICLPARLALPAATIVLGGFVALGLVLPIQNPAIFVWTSPIILEFLCGIAIAHARKNDLTLPLPVSLLMIGAATLAILIDPFGLVHPPKGINVNNFSRLFGWGIPAATIVAAAALSRVLGTSRVALAMAAIGDASYSLYLTHPFVLIVLGKVAIALKAATLVWQTLMLAAILISSVCLALAVHRLFDVPTGRWLSRLTASRSAKLTSSSG